VLVEWTYDYDYEPDGDYDIESERAALRSGELEAFMCCVYLPRVVLGEYGAYVDGWDTVPADVLGGVVAESEDDPYAMDVAAEMVRCVLG
jgi:hypothetical protein